MRLPEFMRRFLLSRAFRVMDSRAPDLVIGERSAPYLARWHLTRTPLLSIYFHDIMRSDDDRALHTHPSWNLSLILAGGYREILLHDETIGIWRGEGEMLFRRPRTPHRLKIISDAGAITMWIRGPTVHHWGFWADRGAKFVPWDEYVAPDDPYRRFAK